MREQGPQVGSEGLELLTQRGPNPNPGLVAALYLVTRTSPLSCAGLQLNLSSEGHEPMMIGSGSEFIIFNVSPLKRAHLEIRSWCRPRKPLAVPSI